MPTIKVYRNIKGTYKIKYNGIELIATPQIVKTKNNIIAVGKTAMILYTALSQRNMAILRNLLPQLMYVANLLA